jgi:acyl-CoA thioesterase
VFHETRILIFRRTYVTIEEARAWLDKSPFHEKCGIQVDSVGTGCCIISACVEEEDRNLWGIAHGGFIATICDAASGLAVSTTHEEYCVTTSSSMHYLLPAKGDQIRAEAKILKDGHTIAVVEVNVYGDDKLLAEGSFEYFCATRKQDPHES